MVIAVDLQGHSETSVVGGGGGGGVGGFHLKLNFNVKHLPECNNYYYYEPFSDLFPLSTRCLIQ